MAWLILFAILPFVIIVGGILYFNIYLRKLITKNTTPKPILDQAYIEAELTKEDDEDFGSAFGGKVSENE
ncbi:MAG: hypothetical protein LBH25_13120 [Fibromonadaceae bacterium]|jgi:hypothetical protein|nr:hypothetical protein [Fibromonadaceae bacterium]